MKIQNISIPLTPGPEIPPAPFLQPQLQGSHLLSSLDTIWRHLFRIQYGIWHALTVMEKGYLFLRIFMYTCSHQKPFLWLLPSHKQIHPKAGLNQWNPYLCVMCRRWVNSIFHLAMVFYWLGLILKWWERPLTWKQLQAMLLLTIQWILLCSRVIPQ